MPWWWIPSKSTLYLFENVNGEPRYVSDFYISVGKKGADKVSEGDQNTPLGVYFVNSHLTKDKLTDFYGSGAYPLSYPNEWDKRLGRDGHGIWLHGTPSDTYSRPPRASNGCVVLANNDLNDLGSHLQIGVTPVIIASKIDWSDEADRTERSALLKEIEQWRSDWASRNTEAYLTHYARDFSTGSVNLPAFARAETPGQFRQDLDQGQDVERQHLPLPQPAESGGGQFRTGLRQQQPFQPHAQAPVLDETGRALADCL